MQTLRREHATGCRICSSSTPAVAQLQFHLSKYTQCVNIDPRGRQYDLNGTPWMEAIQAYTRSHSTSAREAANLQHGHHGQLQSRRHLDATGPAPPGSRLTYTQSFTNRQFVPDGQSSPLARQSLPWVWPGCLTSGTGWPTPASTPTSASTCVRQWGDVGLQACARAHRGLSLGASPGAIRGQAQASPPRGRAIGRLSQPRSSCWRSSSVEVRS